jgi:hypothetical protein
VRRQTWPSCARRRSRTQTRSPRALSVSGKGRAIFGIRTPTLPEAALSRGTRPGRRSGPCLRSEDLFRLRNVARMAGGKRCSATGCRVALLSGWARSPHRRSPSRRTSPAWRPHASPYVSAVRQHQRRVGAEDLRRRRGRPLQQRRAWRPRNSARLPPGSVRERFSPRDKRVSPRTGRALPRTAKNHPGSADRPSHPWRSAPKARRRKERRQKSRFVSRGSIGRSWLTSSVQQVREPLD